MLGIKKRNERLRLNDSRKRIHMIPGRGYMSQTIKTLAVLYDIVYRDLPYGMTIEDDKIVDVKTYKSLINDILEKAPNGWHVI